MDTIIIEFPGSIIEFSCWRENFDDEARRLDGLRSAPITWIARHRYIRMEVACLRNVDLHIGTIGATVTATQKLPEDALDIGFDGVIIGGSSCHRIDTAIDVLVASFRIIFFKLKVFLNRHGLPMF